MSNFYPANQKAIKHSREFFLSELTQQYDDLDIEHQKLEDNMISLQENFRFVEAENHELQVNLQMHFEKKEIDVVFFEAMKNDVKNKLEYTKLDLEDMQAEKERYEDALRKLAVETGPLLTRTKCLIEENGELASELQRHMLIIEQRDEAFEKKMNNEREHFNIIIEKMHEDEIKQKEEMKQFLLGNLRLIWKSSFFLSDFVSKD
jgi:hypothetical protein